MCSGSAAAPTAVCAARCGVKVCVLQCARYGHGVQAAGRHALVRARMREERRRPLAEVGHRLVVIEADHRADVVAQELCKPHEESRIWQQVSKYKELKRGGRDANTQTAALKRQRSKHARLNHSDYAALGLHERNITCSRVRRNHIYGARQVKFAGAAEVHVSATGESTRIAMWCGICVSRDRAHRVATVVRPCPKKIVKKTPEYHLKVVLIGYFPTMYT